LRGRSTWGGSRDSAGGTDGIACDQVCGECTSEGTKIWTFTEGIDWMFRPGELALFPGPSQGRLRHYAYLNQATVF